jgi:hypothetical protein
MRTELQSVLALFRALPSEDLPGLLGELEQVRVTAMARLASPAPVPAAPDELLDVKEASQRLRIGTAYLYKNHAKFPFTRRIGSKLLFSSVGIGEYLRKKH